MPHSPHTPPIPQHPQHAKLDFLIAAINFACPQHLTTLSHLPFLPLIRTRRTLSCFFPPCLPHRYRVHPHLAWNKHLYNVTHTIHLTLLQYGLVLTVGMIIFFVSLITSVVLAVNLVILLTHALPHACCITTLITFLTMTLPPHLFTLTPRMKSLLTLILYNT